MKSKGTSGAWKAVKPALKNVHGVLESAFANFTPKAEHVLLVALLVVVLFSAERVCGALRANTAAIKAAAKDGGGHTTAPPTPDAARKKER